MSVDDLLPEPWTQVVIDALDPWEQGHLIECDHMAWLAEGGAVDTVVRADYSFRPPGFLSATIDLADTGYAAVASQTCDIAGSGPGARHPFVQICPVRDVGKAFSKEKVDSIRRGEVVEYVYLTQPPLAGSDWAIDLRASTPLSKGVLVTKSPIRGFASERDALNLGTRLAAKAERPAVHDYIAKDFLEDLNRVVTKARKANAEWYEDVEQFRLEIEGPRLTPQRLRLITVVETSFGGIHHGKKAALRDLWKRHKKPMSAHGISQSPLAFRHIDQWTIKDYRNSIPLTVPALGRGRFD